MTDYMLHPCIIFMSLVIHSVIWPKVRIFPTKLTLKQFTNAAKFYDNWDNKKELHYTDVQTISNIFYENESNWREIWRKWKKAFSVERVTEDFFEDYKNTFFALRNDLNKQRISKKESHEFTLQFLNRIMFIYFISKKKWLEQPKFMDWLWQSYKCLNKYNSDEFYEKWLRQIFFKAFNNRANEITGLPSEVTKTVTNFPYLNGGLFKENKLDKLSGS